MIDADPPIRLPNGQADSWELIVEGPAKAHEARKSSLYGTWSTNSSDQYRFWLVQSPAWVVPLSWMFKLFGAGWLQLRWFSLLIAGVGFIGLLGLAWQHYKRVGMLVVGVCLGLDYYLFHYERAGLLEPALNTWLILTTSALLLSLSNVRWLILAQLTLMLAVLTKQSALFYLPVFAGMGIASLVQSRRRDDPVHVWGAVAGFSALCFVLLLLWMSSDEYIRTLKWNLGHVVYDDVARDDISGLPVGQAILRIFDLGRLRRGVLLQFPVLLPLAVLQLGSMARRAYRRQPISAFELAIAAWAVLAFAALQLTPHVRVRFSLILFPALALLAAGGAHLLVDALGKTDLRRKLLIAAPAVAAVVVNGISFARWAFGAETELRDGNKSLARILAPGDVIIGIHAAPLAMDSQADHFYVKDHFNETPEILEALHVTHVLDPEDGPVIERMRGTKTPWAKGERVVTEVPFKGRTYFLWDIADEDD
jgi:4-amino-4-deoxy-L-arabinose transferase-like glycosyltransferase